MTPGLTALASHADPTSFAPSHSASDVHATMLRELFRRKVSVLPSSSFFIGLSRRPPSRARHPWSRLRRLRCQGATMPPSRDLYRHLVPQYITALRLESPSAGHSGWQELEKLSRGSTHCHRKEALCIVVGISALKSSLPTSSRYSAVKAARDQISMVIKVLNMKDIDSQKTWIWEHCRY